jgi:DNA polymerase-3 subunit delta'
VDACGRCASCDRIARGIHPDVLWSAPSPRFIDIGTIRQLSKAVGYAPHEGRRRVVVIDDAQAMKPPAQNAFLKTLEEPPASSLIILVTPTPGSLLATVRSRCQSLRFSPVPLPQVREYLERHQQMDAGEARLRASLAPGSIGAAIAVDLDAYARLLEIVVDALRLASAGGGGIVAAADELAGAGAGETATQRAASTLFAARDVLRDLLVVSSGADLNTLVNIDRIEAWRAWAAEVDPGGVAEALGAVNAGIERLVGPGIQPNIKMSLERTLIDVFRALQASRQGQAAGTRR